MSVPETILPGVFNKNVRPFLDAIDNLRHFGLDEDLQLPTVVVIGDQSSGKSSIIEAISGVQLPRGTGMVTKCPLQLQMKRSKTSVEWSATLTYKDKTGNPVKKILTDPFEVGSAIRQAQEDMIGVGDTISDSLLSLSIVDSHVPDLTLIDLPGIARVAVGDQAQDLPEQIMTLLRKFISRKESLILTVCPCTTDLATTEALKLAQEYDPECQRTFGVLTKADLIDKGSEDSILQILNNEVVPLSKGYTIVKCRSQDALMKKQSLKESLKKEKLFFENHKVFRTLDKSQWGIETLSKKLALDLFNFIKRELPTIRKTILEKQKSISDQLNRLVFDYPTTTETRLMFSLQSTYKFLSVFYDLTDGKYYSEVLENIEKSIKPLGTRKSTKPNMRLIPHARNMLDTLQNQLTKVTPEGSLSKTIEELLTMGQGKEPRDFLSFDTFKKIALEFIKGTEVHITDCMEIIYANLQLVLQYLLDYFFVKYPVFKSNLAILVLDSLKSAKESCTKDLELMLNKEKVFFTMDKIYDEKIESLVALQNVTYALRADWLQYFTPPPTPQQLQHQQQQKPDPKKNLPQYVVVYYMLAIRRMCDHVSQSILYLLMSDLHTTLKDKLPPHVAQPGIYNLLEEATVGIEDRKKMLRLKSDGLKKGAVEIEKLLFNQGFSNDIKKEALTEEGEGEGEEDEERRWEEEEERRWEEEEEERRWREEEEEAERRGEDMRWWREEEEERRWRVEEEERRWREEEGEGEEEEGEERRGGE